MSDIDGDGFTKERALAIAFHVRKLREWCDAALETEASQDVELGPYIDNLCQLLDLLVPPPSHRDRVIEDIARQELGLVTFEVRNRDRLDFREQHVTTLKRALERAYEAGRQK